MLRHIDDLNLALEALRSVSAPILRRLYIWIDPSYFGRPVELSSIFGGDEAPSAR